MNPPPHKQRHDGLDEAIQNAKLRHLLVGWTRDRADQAVEIRRTAIEDALRLGATLRELAEQLGVAPESVRNMTSQAPAWLRHMGRLDQEPRYKQGYEAGAAGHPADNPYGVSPDAHAWNDGWRVGRAHHDSTQAVPDLAEMLRRLTT